MTPRGLLSLARLGALTVATVAAAVMVFCGFAGAILYVASFGHSGAQLLADIALAMALAAVFSWSGGVLLLATAAWLIAEAIGRAFAPREGRR